MDDHLAAFSESILAELPRLAGVVMLLVFGWILAGYARSATRRALKAASLDLTLAKFVSDLIRWLVILPVVLAALGLLGVQTTTFAAAIGAAGLAIALAFQGTLSNVASGVMLLTFRPFKVGDRIVGSGTAGTVDEIGILYTTLDNDDGVRIAAPNSNLFASPIQNRTHHEHVAAVVEVQVPMTQSLGAWRELFVSLTADSEEALGRLYERVTLLSVTDQQSVWRLRVWRPGSARGGDAALLEKVQETLRSREVAGFSCKAA